jgi:heme/copper-type cytochrome/quinol oxidase subunit 2
MALGLRLVRSTIGFRAKLLACILLAMTPAMAGAEDEVTFRIAFKDGVVTPNRLEVPANRRIVLELVNLGETPAEFESLELRKEKVLAPGSSSTLVLRTLDPGEYQFFDDFHPQAPPSVLIAK